MMLKDYQLMSCKASCGSRVANEWAKGRGTSTKGDSLRKRKREGMVLEESKAYRLNDPITRIILVSKDVVFAEHETRDWSMVEENKMTECDKDGTNNIEH